MVFFSFRSNKSNRLTTEIAFATITLARTALKIAKNESLIIIKKKFKKSKLIFYFPNYFLLQFINLFFFIKQKMLKNNFYSKLLIQSSREN